MLTLLPLMVAAVDLPFLLLGFRAFGALVDLERTRHPRAWERDGRPGRLAWSGQPTRNWLSTQRCTMAWLFKTPSWVKTDPEALLQLRRSRVFIGIWNLGVVPVFAASLYAAVTGRAG